MSNIVKKNGRPRLWTNAKKLDKMINDYFDACVDNDKIPTITGLAVELGTYRDALNDYGSGMYDDDNNCFSYVIKNAKARCERAILEGGVTGKVNPAMSIFILKNCGWSDKQDINVESNVHLTYETYLKDLENDDTIDVKTLDY